MVFPSISAPVNISTQDQFPGGYDYYSRKAVYSPSTMLASGSIASTAGATVSAWGRGADSSAAGAEASSAAAVLGSSPSQDKSVDFLHNT
jgi:hypothetical protein